MNGRIKARISNSSSIFESNNEVGNMTLQSLFILIRCLALSFMLHITSVGSQVGLVCHQTGKQFCKVMCIKVVLVLSRFEEATA